MLHLQDPLQATTSSNNSLDILDGRQEVGVVSRVQAIHTTMLNMLPLRARLHLDPMLHQPTRRLLELLPAGRARRSPMPATSTLHLPVLHLSEATTRTTHPLLGPRLAM